MSRKRTPKNNLQTSIAIVALATCAWAAPSQAQVSMCTGSDTTPASACYRLLCNTTVSGGTIRSDECSEACDLNTPTRWATPFVDVTAETLSGSIDNVSSSDWTSVVNESLAQWNGISSSNLQFSLTGAAPSRQYAANLGSHEVF